MKRSTPLQRTTPLRRGAPLTARRPLTRSARSGRSRPLKSRPSGRARPNEPLADWCEARIDGVCHGRAVHRHHRLMRSQGGGDEATNTAELCGACHQHIHDNPAWSYGAGWLLHPTSNGGRNF